MTYSPPSPPAVPTLASLARQHVYLLLGAALCMAVTALSTAAYAYLVGPVLRALFGEPQVASPLGGPLSGMSHTLSTLGPKGLGALVVATALVKGLAHYGQVVLAARASQASLAYLRQRAYEGLLRKNPVDDDRRARGELAARFCVDVEAVEGALSGGVVALLRDSLQIAALAALLLLLDPFLAGVGLLAFPPTALVIVHLARRLRNTRAKVHGTFGQLAEAVDETAAALEVAQAFHGQGLLTSRFERWNQSLAQGTLRALRVRALSSPLNELLAGLALALTLLYAHSRIDSGTLSPESFVSFFTALFLLYQPVKGLSAALSAMASGRAALERLEPLLSLAQGPATTTPNPSSPLRFSHLELRDLTAGYGDGPDILRGATLTLDAGQSVALMGESGAGKTTLLRVLLGFVPLRCGQVLIDGRAVNPSPDLLGRLFAVVPQEPFLLRGSILENVRLGRPDARDQELVAACQQAGVLAFSAALPDGLKTQVGRDGATLSVGQRQRICLARALASGAPILLLDEVQAPLDPDTEKEINEQLRAMRAHRAILAVTHRPSTAAAMQRTLWLRDGRIEDTGYGVER